MCVKWIIFRSCQTVRLSYLPVFRIDTRCRNQYRSCSSAGTVGRHDVPREKSYAVIPNRWKTFTIASSCATGPISSIIVLRSGGCSRNTMQKAVLCPYWRKAFRSGSMNMFCGNLHNPVEPKNNNRAETCCFCPCFIHIPSLPRPGLPSVRASDARPPRILLP